MADALYHDVKPVAEPEESRRTTAIALSLCLSPFLAFLYLAKPKLALLHALNAAGVALLWALGCFLDIQIVAHMPFIFPFGLLVNVAGTLHVGNLPPQRSQGRRPRYAHGAFVLSIPVAFGIACSVLLSFGTLKRMPGPSMMPTIGLNDRFLLIVGTPEPQALRRGDLIVFRSSKASGDVPRVSRIIGMPGDRVRMSAGWPYLNGEPLERHALEECGFRRDGSAPPGGCFHETLPDGRAYVVMEEAIGSAGSFDNHPDYRVPPDSYFVISDNRDVARDSRDMANIGPIPRGEILGKALPLRISPVQRRWWKSRLFL